MSTETALSNKIGEVAPGEDPGSRWTRIIEPRESLFSLNLREVWQYRDLLFLLVRRDFVALYKQTILGPLWFFIQPLLQTIIFTVVFGGIANISTDGLPGIVFYMAGVTCWNYFSETLNKTSETFTVNAQIFGKVYFPRVIVPLSIVLSNLLKFGVQFLMFLVVWGYFMAKGKSISPNWAILLLPVVIGFMAGIGLGLGMIVSSLTTKYRDLRFLIQFGVQLAMYATPVIYPVSSIPAKYAGYVASNPITPLVETFRYGWLGQGQFSWMGLGYSGAFCLVIVSLGMLIFNRVEKTFMDTV